MVFPANLIEIDPVTTVINEKSKTDTLKGSYYS